MNFIASLLCTLLDSLFAESQTFLKSKTLKNILGFSGAVLLVAVVVTTLFSFINAAGVLK
jgi:hypothetical protein